MIKKHLITKEHKQDIIYLYLDNKYEIATELYITKDNPTLINNIYNYLSNNNISYKHKDIFLVIDNIIVAKLNKKFLSNKLKYLELIHYGKTSYNDNLDDYPSIKFIDIVNSEKIIKKVKFNINLENLIKKENIDIEYDNNYITLKIKRNMFYSNNNNIAVAMIQSGGDVEEDYYVENIDPYNIKAALKNDMLRVLIPKNTHIDKDTTIIDVDDYKIK